MIAVDTNLLIYAHRNDSAFHAPAKAWLGRTAAANAAWAIPWPCVNEFLSISTNPRIYRERPTTDAEAIAQVEAWMQSPTLVLIGENEDYWPEIRDLAVTAAITGPRLHDARIAAICRAHGITQIATCDRDFSRFAGISVFNPLLGDQLNEGAGPRRKRARTAP